MTFGYANCENCPHRDVPPELKMHFNIAHNVDYFLHCDDKADNSTVYCFESGMIIDWDLEMEIFQEMSDEYGDIY